MIVGDKFGTNSQKTLKLLRSGFDRTFASEK